MTDTIAPPAAGTAGGPDPQWAASQRPTPAPPPDLHHVGAAGPQASAPESRGAVARGRRHSAGNIALGLAGMGLGIALGLYGVTRTAWIPGQPGELINELGRIAALVGTYGSLIVLLLAARIPWLERQVGQDRLLGWHRKIAPWALGLVAAHVLLNTLGYALGSGVSLWSQLVEFVGSTPWMLPALVGFVIMLVVGFSSAKVARRRMKYETWWVVHLYAYVGIALAYLHQVLYGQTFVGHPWAERYWLGLYLLTFGSFLLFRVGLPIWTNLRHQLRVSRVVRESADTVSVYVTGRRLDRLSVQGGQFFNWRFAIPKMWWEAHAYSLSAAPNDRELRITVKDLGDHSKALAQLRPGTRAFVEGPYGALTAEHRSDDRVVLVAGGVGVTPIRALLEELPASAHVEVLYRAPRAEAVVLWRELDALAASRPNTRVRYLVGNRRQFPLDARWLYQLVPWVGQADLYVCGPEDLNRTVIEAAAVLQIPADRVHSEAFTF